MVLVFSTFLQEWLKKSDDMALQEFREECRDRARQLEQLVISDVSHGATDLDPSALLAEARRSYLASNSSRLGCVNLWSMFGTILGS